MTTIKSGQSGTESLGVAQGGHQAPADEAQPRGAMDDEVSKIRISGVASVVSSLKDKTVSTADAVAENVKELLKSTSQKDSDAVDNMVHGFREQRPAQQSQSEQSCAKFKAALDSTIDVKFAGIMLGKPDANRFLTYVDGQILTGCVRNVFRSALGVVPPQIEVACNLSEAILAPSSQERRRLLKAAVGMGGGATGVGMILAGVGGALGWGAGAIASLTAWVAGTSLAGPFGWTIAGLTLTGLAAYFATTSDGHIDTERFLRALKNSCSRAIEAIWAQHEEALTRVLSHESAK